MVLIEACAKLAARKVRFRLELMGQWRSEAFSDWVQQRIRELNLEGEVSCLGVKVGGDKYDTYRRADVVCFPTFYNCETFGNVLVEAMACGLPVVSTHWRGIPSIVDDGETGFLVAPRDSEALADRLELLAGDAELRWRMGRAGRAKFEQEYVYPIHAQRMQRAIFETAGVMIDEVSEFGADSSARQRSWDGTEDFSSKSESGAVPV
jgi:glycosyltransferase involved in cell wall biosynthesis